ncbi:MerR family transcriptional regulator [Propionicicella superfundia]|uniref:transcriptional regulator FtsR n=1 Tax=Propionicicella superfundia TaxID=348582 RepID=UPI000409C98B|nr:MerR family transcriptional regulator [Propionicicella superfundia]
MPDNLRSIGQVLATLKPDFPDISISKIRFLESEGLLAPLRAPSGYRRYSQADIDRLHYILTMQRDHYLPLKVIREHLDKIDRGEPPPSADVPATPPPPVSEEIATQPLQTPRPPRRPLRLTRRELLRMSGLSESVLAELERQQLIAPRRGTAYYSRDALTIAVVARKLLPYGMDVRHLRVIKQAAEREVGLLEQAIAPYTRRSSSTRQVTTEVMQLVLYAHAAVMRSSLTP